MTTRQISLVKSTWKLFRNMDPAVVGDAFYSKLFSQHPSLRKMFPSEMSMQYQKLMDMLTTIVSRLDKLDELTNDIADMARRHEGYGVKIAHYKIVGDALLWTLEHGLGRDWNQEVAEAWQTCYKILSDTMIGALKH
jgi:hemoglobin-like flavoprotein